MFKVKNLVGALLLILILVTGSMVSGCTPAEEREGELPNSIIFGVLPVGGSMYVIGAGLSTVIDRYLPSTKVITQSFPSSVPQTDALAKGELDVALQVVGQWYLCTLGLEEYKEWGPRPVRVLGMGSSSVHAFFTTPDTGIKTIQDLAGKKVAYISAVSKIATDVDKYTMEFYGVLDNVESLKRGGLNSAANQLIEGKIDAYAGPLGSHFEILKAAKGAVIIGIPPDAVAYVNEKVPTMQASSEVAPKGLYGIEQDTPVLALPHTMAVNRDCSEELAYAITKAVYDHPKELADIHHMVGRFTIERTLQFPSPVAYHPAAIKYYKEKGVWTAELDNLQQKLLAQEK
ncbi:TAXI family TRAP transporter solute-binding subunit [Chloroflexota bacterium]